MTNHFWPWGMETHMVHEFISSFSLSSPSLLLSLSLLFIPRTPSVSSTAILLNWSSIISALFGETHWRLYHCHTSISTKPSKSPTPRLQIGANRELSETVATTFPTHWYVSQNYKDFFASAIIATMYIHSTHRWEGAREREGEREGDWERERETERESIIINRWLGGSLFWECQDKSWRLLSTSAHPNANKCVKSITNSEIFPSNAYRTQIYLFYTHVQWSTYSTYVATCAYCCN